MYRSGRAGPHIQIRCKDVNMFHHVIIEPVESYPNIVIYVVSFFYLLEISISFFTLYHCIIFYFVLNSSL